MQTIIYDHNYFANVLFINKWILEVFVDFVKFTRFVRTSTVASCKFGANLNIVLFGCICF